METSCTDESTTSDAAVLPPPSTAVPLSRMGSGASVVLDPTDADQQAESKKLPSSKYKGVVPQPNGRWGAQIYEKHHRVWLGTFTAEHCAAQAYDLAAHRFRGPDAVTNFAPLSDAAELSFLLSRSKSEIVDMLRKHTYSDELLHSRRHFNLNHHPARQCHVSQREQLFEKTVTPSDVGKLNRLVIPKQHAEKNFPLPPAPELDSVAGAVKGLLLNFEDLGEKVWRFRYSYWNSSQSYVLTKGWSRFVKEKSLRAGDVVSFHRSTGPDKRLFIDWRPKAAALVADGPSIRLFGVDIHGGAGSRKRGRADGGAPDLIMTLATESKKQMVVGGLT